jgi:hypothetical protein
LARQFIGHSSSADRVHIGHSQPQELGIAHEGYRYDRGFLQAQGRHGSLEHGARLDELGIGLGELFTGLQLARGRVDGIDAAPDHQKRGRLIGGGDAPADEEGRSSAQDSAENQQPPPALHDQPVLA